MAVDKLVDSTQLDSNLASVANAIRTKGGTSADLAFPAGFVSAIEDIPTGGSDTLTQLLKNQLVSYDVPTNIPEKLFYNKTNLESVTFPKTGITVGTRAFQGCTKLGNIHIVGSGNSNGNMFTGDTAMTLAVYRGFTNVGAYDFQNCSNLTTLDVTVSTIAASAFSSAAKLGVLVLRRTSITSLANVNAFNGTKFKSGGAGGTIYIPESLYDHLGDGGTSDYKAATNWATVNGYGTITWAKIEGSIYETAYADGTPIS